MRTSNASSMLSWRDCAHEPPTTRDSSIGGLTRLVQTRRKSFRSSESEIRSSQFASDLPPECGLVVMQKDTEQSKFLLKPRLSELASCVERQIKERNYPADHWRP